MKRIIIPKINNFGIVPDYDIDLQHHPWSTNINTHAGEVLT